MTAFVSLPPRRQAVGSEAAQDVRKMDDLLVRYKDYPDSLDRARRSVQQRLAKAVDTGERDIKAALVSSDISKAKAVLEQYEGEEANEKYFGPSSPRPSSKSSQFPGACWSLPLVFAWPNMGESGST